MPRPATCDLRPEVGFFYLGFRFIFLPCIDLGSFGSWGGFRARKLRNHLLYHSHCPSVDDCSQARVPCFVTEHTVVVTWNLDRIACTPLSKTRTRASGIQSRRRQSPSFPILLHSPLFHTPNSSSSPSTSPSRHSVPTGSSATHHQSPIKIQCQPWIPLVLQEVLRRPSHVRESALARPARPRLRVLRRQAR